jgi:hypothetical protein
VVCNRFVGRGNFQGFVEVWFSDLYGYWRTRLSSDFGGFVLVGRVGFSLRISEINKVTEHKFVSHICVDDSSLILLFHCIYFQSIIFSVKLFSDNN